MTTATKNTHFFADSQHQANIAAALAHRIEVAQANRDSRLLSLLEREKQQLEAWSHSTPRLHGGQRIQQWLQAIRQQWRQRSQLQVKLTQDADGNRWWYAHDPRTGKTLYAESAADVMCWIEEHRLGT
ncbi:hypothetical protein [Almyronema epifaneia]|uniref:Uncharacterized protein n=1 Tax=Almyronema epifaneia S1 TaxID=2991925 RepID=A0ABW6IKK8_9CYAN